MAIKLGDRPALGGVLACAEVVRRRGDSDGRRGCLHERDRRYQGRDNDQASFERGLKDGRRDQDQPEGQRNDPIPMSVFDEIPKLLAENEVVMVVDAAGFEARDCVVQGEQKDSQVGDAQDRRKECS